MNTGEKVVLGVAVGVALALVGAIAYEEGKAKAATNPPAPPSPIWTSLSPQSDGSFIIPNGATFALSALASNPNTPVVVADFNGFVATGQVTPNPAAFPAAVGTTPTNWPSADNGGTAAVRFSGKANGDVRIPAPEAQAASIWTS